MQVSSPYDGICVGNLFLLMSIAGRRVYAQVFPPKKASVYITELLCKDTTSSPVVCLRLPLAVDTALTATRRGLARQVVLCR